MKQISILGCGWLGMPLAKSLLEKEFSVNGSTTTLEKISAMESNGIQAFQIELSETEIKGKIDSFLENSEILIVTIPPKLRSISSENFIKKIQNLVPFIEKAKIEKIIFISSTSVYGDYNSVVTEATKSNPDSESGKQLLETETFLQSNTNFKTTVIRFGGLIGEDPRGVPNNLMPFVAQVAIGKLNKLSVYGGDYATADGTGVRDYIHVMDLAEGHLAALNFLTQQSGLHTFNLGTGRGYSVLEMIKAFEAASGKPVPFSVAPRRTGDIASCYASVDFSAKQLGWRATRDLKDMCESGWRFAQQVEQ
jgi:UDP-glucose 4-epimerase